MADDGTMQYKAGMIASSQNLQVLAKRLNTLVQTFESTNKKNIAGLTGAYLTEYDNAQNKLNQVIVNMANILHSSGTTVADIHGDAQRTDSDIASMFG